MWDANRGSIARVRATLDEPVGLQPVQVARHRGAFDAEMLRDRALGRPLGAVVDERVQDEPCRVRGTHGLQPRVEHLASCLCRQDE